MGSPAPPSALPLALTMGEPAGIGGEIALKVWAARHADTPVFFAIDDVARLERLAKQFKIECSVAPITNPAEAAGLFSRALPVLALRTPLARPPVLGTPDVANAKAVIGAIDQAVDFARSGLVSGLVTAPISKSVLLRAGFASPGHTEYLSRLAGGVPTAMMLAVEGLRVVPVTVHVALRDVARHLTTDAILRCGRITATALQTHFGISTPRLAVAALNPHAGEVGTMGDEESRLIAPAVAALRAEGIDVAGPKPADTLFHPAARAGFDAALCMYHDQALIPLKTLDFAGGVNVTLGLPFVRTSPDHGTAFDIAVRGTADPSSLRAALRMASQMAARGAARAA